MERSPEVLPTRSGDPLQSIKTEAFPGPHAKASQLTIRLKFLHSDFIGIDAQKVEAAHLHLPTCKFGRQPAETLELNFGCYNTQFSSTSQQKSSKMSIAAAFTKAAGKRSRDEWEEVDDVEELKSLIEAKEVPVLLRVALMRQL